jgi:hypothetical protein
VVSGEAGSTVGAADDVRAAGGVDLLGLAEPGPVALAEPSQRGQVRRDHGREAAAGGAAAAGGGQPDRLGTVPGLPCEGG